jgi:predicted transcriptional regulator
MSLFDLVFGCSHHRCSFPLTVKSQLQRNPVASVTGTYIVCLDCGKEFPYDWKEMKLVREKRQSSAAVAPIAVAPDKKAA